MELRPAVPPRIAVTGASGRLGGLVARLLADRGIDQLLLGRSPERLPSLPRSERRGPAEYADTDAMARALDGADAVLLVSAGLAGDRFVEHMSVVDAAQRVGASRVVYVSLIGASPVGTFAHSRDHWETEFALARSSVESAVIRPGYYASMLSAQADEDRVIHTLDEDGRISAVSHVDIAEVAVALLTGVAPTGAPLAYDGTVYEVTGPQSLTWLEIAMELSEATGERYSIREETLTQSIARRALTEPDPRQIERWVSWHTSIARGEAARASDTVERILGRPATSLAEALRATA